MLTTAFTTLIGCTAPIQQAGMGSLSGPRLASAVANAGGLGTVVVYGEPPDLVARQLDEARSLTTGALGANFIMLFVEPDQAMECVAAAAERVRVVDFFYTDPEARLIDVVHQHGALACWQVGSPEEARMAVDAGCDFIIAQGIEAGGHVRGTMGLLPLLDAVLTAVDVPVLAAGGIGSGRSLAAVLAAGATGARIGTRFVAAEEAGAHSDYVHALIAAEPRDTIYTETFSVGWPDAPHRVLRSCVAAAEANADEIIGEIRYWTKPVPIPRFSCLTIDQTTTGDIAAMPHWAGESVGSVTKVQPAAAIVTELVDEAERLLGPRWRV